jgi:DNA-binding MarR family transcriptional regulator
MDSRNDLCNCFAARQAARALTREYERHLAPSGLTSSQFPILIAIDERPGVGMRELAEQLVMDRTSLVRALKPLQRDGLVAVATAAGGPRQNALSLTPAGVAKISEAAPLWQKAQDEFVERFGGEGPAAEARSAFHRMSQLG